MTTYFCDNNSIEANAAEQLSLFKDKGLDIAVFPDIHYCSEKNLPVGVSFKTTDRFYPLITGKDLGCGVMYLKFKKEDYIKPFDKEKHYRAFDKYSYQMTDDGLGGGNHFLSLEEGKNDIYIICHTGSRNLGIALYQRFVGMIDEFNYKEGLKDSFLPKEYLTETLVSYYNSVLDFARDRRKDFVLNTLYFLQHNGYVKCTQSTKLGKINFKKWENNGSLNGVDYQIQDSIHNHIRFSDRNIIHRKGSTELISHDEVVIPLSMTRGSLIVKPGYDIASLELSNYSCSHGAGRQLSRIDTLKHWGSGMKESERKLYRERFSELLDRSGDFPKGYIQEFDFAYKLSKEILDYQPHLIKVDETNPIVTVKFTEI